MPISKAILHRKEYPDPYLTTEAALARAKGPSLGTIAVAGLIITLSEALIWILRLLRRVSLTYSSGFVY